MTPVAWIVFLAATIYTIWDGVRRSRGAKDLEGFFAAGRAIPWWAAGLSVMATQLSAITILSGAGMGYERGPEWVQFYFALPFAMIVLCIWFVPALRQHPVLTAYEYLERRFGPVTRSLTSLAFLFSRCFAFAAVLYAPAVVFSVMTELPIGPTLWITGLATTAYTVIGGTGGVVWTDVKQMLVIVFGIAACFLLLAWDAVSQLGADGTLTALAETGKLAAVQIHDPAWTFVPHGKGGEPTFWSDKYNLWTGLFGTLCLFLSYFGCDQSQVQSMLTAKSANASRSALLVSAFTKVPLQLLVLLMGGLLFVHHSLASEPLLFQPQEERIAAALDGKWRVAFDAAAADHRAAAERRAAAMRSDADATGRAAVLRAAAEAAAKARRAARQAVHDSEVAAGRRQDGTSPSDEKDYILPQFLFHGVPKPLLGLMLAAIFAAAISSAAGALSSLTSASMVDFYRRWVRPNADETTSLRHSRIVMAIWGVAATAAAQTLGGGTLIETVNEIGSHFYGSILGVFLLALFVPRANGVAASVGLLAGLVAVFVVDHTLDIAFLWYNLVGAVGCVTAGAIVATFRSRTGAVVHAASGADATIGGWARTYWLVAGLAVVVMALLVAMSSIGT